MESPPGQVCGVPPSYWGRRFLLRISYLGGNVQAGPPTHEWLSAALVFLGLGLFVRSYDPKPRFKSPFYWAPLNALQVLGLGTFLDVGARSTTMSHPPGEPAPFVLGELIGSNILFKAI